MQSHHQSIHTETKYDEKKKYLNFYPNYGHIDSDEKNKFDAVWILFCRFNKTKKYDTQNARCTSV